MNTADSPRAPMQSDTVFNAEDAKDNISDLMTILEGHDAWMREQSNTTSTRLNALNQATKQGDRLRTMLHTQLTNSPSRQQYELVIALKTDFLKAIARIQDEMVSAHSASAQSHSLEDAKRHAQSLQSKLDVAQRTIAHQSSRIDEDEGQIHALQLENDRLSRLKDLLMQQQDAMNQRLSAHKGKEQQIPELRADVERLTTELSEQQTRMDALNSEKRSIEALQTSMVPRETLTEVEEALRLSQSAQSANESKQSES